MRLTKLVHSCVLIEDDGLAALLNPGIYSWQSGVVNLDKISKLDYVVVTHKHPDHLGEPFVQALVQKFPEAQWVAPPDAHEDLKKLGVQKVTEKNTGPIETEVVSHAKVEPFGPTPQNLIVHWNGKVTDPGDTHDFSATKDVLLLPVQAPWGTTIRAFEIGLELKPKYLIPIHDWMWNEQWRNIVYDGLERVFADGPTKFIRPVDGQAIEV